ncbi:hypothetical protein GCM10027051_15500 [Niabella terrae]
MSRIDQLEKLLEAQAGDSFLQHALALEYIKAGDDQRAAALFTTLLKKDPDYVGSYYHLGKLYERRGDETAAVQTYEAGMQAAQRCGDRHAYGELRTAHEELTF